MRSVGVRLTLVCISLIVIGLAFTNLCVSRIDPESIMGMWLFDEGSGKVAEDFSENGNDGEIFGKPEWVDGKFGKALEFNGESDWVQIPDDPSLWVSTEVTVMAWIKPERYACPGTQWQGILAKANNPRSYSVYTEDLGRFLLGIHSGGQGFCGGSGGFHPPLKEWSHVTALAETTKEGGNMRFFMNGDLAMKTPFPGLKDLPGDSDTRDVVALFTDLLDSFVNPDVRKYALPSDRFAL